MLIFKYERAIELCKVVFALLLLLLEMNSHSVMLPDDNTKILADKLYVSKLALEISTWISTKKLTQFRYKHYFYVASGVCVRFPDKLAIFCFFFFPIKCVFCGAATAH